MTIPIEQGYHKYKKLLDTKGVSLRSVYVSEIGLAREDALQAVEYLREASVPILGGDLYYIKGDKIVHDPASWSIDRKYAEPHNEYIQRSYQATIEFINRIQGGDKEKPLFAFVVGEDIHLLL
jgi:hypothetical protein